MISLCRRYHLAAGVQALRECQIGAPVTVPLVFIGHADMAARHVATAERDIVLEALPHVQHQDQLCTVGVDVLDALYEVIPCSRPLKVWVIIIGHQIVPVRRLVERQFDTGGRVENMHGGRTAFHAIHLIEPLFLCFT